MSHTFSRQCEVLGHHDNMSLTKTKATKHNKKQYAILINMLCCDNMLTINSHSPRWWRRWWRCTSRASSCCSVAPTPSLETDSAASTSHSKVSSAFLCTSWVTVNSNWIMHTQKCRVEIHYYEPLVKPQAYNINLIELLIRENINMHRWCNWSFI